MDSLIAIAFVFLSAYAIAATALAGTLYGRERLVSKMTLEARRRERRETRKSTQYLAALMQTKGVQLYRRTTPDAEPRPSRNIVIPSQAIQRQRDLDAGLPIQHERLEPVPPAIKQGFLRDATRTNGAAEH